MSDTMERSRIMYLKLPNGSVSAPYVLSGGDVSALLDYVRTAREAVGNTDGVSADVAAYAALYVAGATAAMEMVTASSGWSGSESMTQLLERFLET